MAKKFADANAMFTEFKINLHWSIYALAAPIIQLPLSSRFTEYLDKCLQRVKDLLNARDV